jgi:uncharacterized protein YegL
MKTEIAFILDRSGSMSSMTHAAINGFNAFLEAQQNLRDEHQRVVPATFTLILFDDEYLTVYDRRPIETVVPLTLESYQPRGCTALLDAIGRTIDQLGGRLAATPEAERPAKVIIAILTDGEENASKDYNLNDVNQRITHQTAKYAWEFLFLAANQDAIATASRLGIAAHNSATFAASSDDLESVQEALNLKLRASRKAAHGIPLTAEESSDLSESAAEVLEKVRRRKNP